MAVMWWSFAALCGLALIFVSYPLLSKNSKGEGDGHSNNKTENEDQANIRLYQEHLNDLKQQQLRAEIDAEQFSLLKLELERSLLVDNISGSVAEKSLVDSTTGVSVRLAAVFFVAIPLLAFGIYKSLGSSQDLTILQLLEQTSQAAIIDNPERLKKSRAMTLRGVEQRLASDPDNFFYWVLAGRLYSAEENHSQALSAYQRALLLSPNDVTLLEESLQAAFMVSNGKPSKVLQKLADRLLQLTPNNVPVLGLSAQLAMATGNYRRAIDDYSKVLAALPPEHGKATSILANVAFAQHQLNQQTASDSVAENDNNSAVADANLTLQVAIDMTPDLTLGSSAMLFVIARRPGVRGPPLAVKRLMISELPMQVTLDDSNTMLPGTSLSDSEQLELVARISKSGSPIQQMGDLQGITQIAAASGQFQVSVTIDQVVK